MIRFACPGCSAVFTVPDEKGGKTGKCPKCQSQFVIPDAEPSAGSPAPPPPPPPKPAPPKSAPSSPFSFSDTGTSPPAPKSQAASPFSFSNTGASPPPPPRPAPPPPPAADPNAPVEIAPCPKCQARLSVAASDLGAQIECPYCKAVYTATRPGAAPAAPSPPPARSSKPTSLGDALSGGNKSSASNKSAPSRRSRDEDDDEDDDRPRRRRRDEDDEDDEDDDDRPRGRSRRRDDDEDDDRPRKKRRKSRPGGGMVTALGVIHLLVGLLHFSCGGCGLLGSSFFVAGADIIQQKQKADREMRARNPNLPPAPPLPAAEQKMIDNAKLFASVLIGISILGVVEGLVAAVAGIGCLSKKSFGRGATFVSAGLVGLLLLLSFGFELYMWEGTKTLVRLAVGTLVWGVYGAFCLKVATDPNASAHFN